MNTLQIRRALISVSDKVYLEELARTLASLGVEILATGGTAQALKKAGIQYRPVEEFTGNPEAFDGRMKTLSFKLESAILFDRTNPSHVQQAKQLGIEPIDLVICNFYPFEQTVAGGGTESDWIEEIDVGGPTMVRAAAKNFKSVMVLADPTDYNDVLTEMRKSSGCVSLETRKRLMVRAFERVFQYDRAIFESFAQKKLRYGENPHQQGFFVPLTQKSGMNWDLVDGEGIELSYNNILDAQAAFGAAEDARKIAPAGHGVAVIVKHNNPCGMASAPTVEEAFLRAWAGDPVSAFGGVVALSSPLTLECAKLFDQKFVEVVIAPGFEDEAIEELRRKKKKLRILRSNLQPEAQAASLACQRTRVEGGYVKQLPDEGVGENFKLVTRSKFPHELEPAALFGLAAAKWLKSNAVALTRALPDGGLQLVGTGCGQTNRIDSVRRLALPKTLEFFQNQEKGSISDCILASDAFFPFPDSIEAIHAAGVRYVVQPGGSVKDSEVIAACDKLGVAMVFTGKRHFRH